MATDPLDLAAELIALDDQKKSLTAELKELGGRREALELQLLDIWTQHCLKNMSVQGRTLYLHKQQWVKVLDAEKARALVTGELNCPDVLTVGTARLSAMAREDEFFAQTLRDTGVFSVEDNFAIRIRKA